MSNPVELTLEMLMQEAQATSKRIIGEDRPDLIFHAGELVDVAARLARVTRLPPPADPEAFILELKKRFLFATTLPVVAGIYSDEAVATPIDLTPLRHGGTSWLGVGLAEYRHQHEAIDAPRYFPDQVCYGFVVPGTPEETWYMVREKGDVSFVMLLEHQWIKNSGVDMVIVKDVLGLGREALKMATESQPDLLDWIEQARNAFEERYASLSQEAVLRGVPGFYHFGTNGFRRQPWDEPVGAKQIT